MTIRFYSKGMPFFVKAGHFYFFATCLLTLILMKMKLNFIKGIDSNQDPQLFDNLHSFITYCNKFGEDGIGQLRVFYELDFVFMFGYTGWFAFFVIILNQIKKQVKALNYILIALIISTLLADIYENTHLLVSMCSYESFRSIHSTFCNCSNGNDFFGSYYQFNYWLKYGAALAFIILYLIAYIIARKQKNEFSA
jgi:hypothetical protein